MGSIILRNVGVAAGKPLFQDLSFTLADGDRLGLVAGNGAGKSTLLRCLAGLAEPSAGSITTSRGLRVALVAQEVPATLLELPLAEALRRALPPDERESKGWRVDVILDRFASQKGDSPHFRKGENGDCPLFDRTIRPGWGEAGIRRRGATPERTGSPHMRGDAGGASAYAIRCGERPQASGLGDEDGSAVGDWHAKRALLRPRQRRHPRRILPCPLHRSGWSTRPAA